MYPPRLFHRSTALVAIAVLGALVASAGCDARGRRTPDDTLVVLFESAAKSADPRYAISTYDARVSKLVAPGLMTVEGADLMPRPELAERVDEIDPVTWEVTLRDDVRFSDGTPVTAGDVVWTYQTVIDDQSDSVFHKGFKERFAAVEAIDGDGGRRVRFRLAAPLATFLTDLDFGIVARHAADQDGKFRGGRAIGAGPYVLTSLTATRATLVANRHWHRGAPPTPKLDIRVVRDAAARIIMLAGGSADVVQNAFRYDLIDDLLGRERVREVRGPSNILTYMLLNNEDPALRDVRVRRAIALALDREAVIARKFAGRAVLATGFIPPGHWAYADVGRFGPDLAQAGRLLDEAGFPDPPGPAPRLRLIYKTSNDQFRIAIARVLAGQLARIGIAVEVRPFEFATFFADVKKGNYQLASMQTADVTEPDTLYTYFHSSRIPDAKNPDVHNRWRYRSAELDRLVDAGRRETDRARRIPIYAEAQRVLAEDLPIIPLWHEDNVAIVNRSVVGFEVVPNARLVGLARARKEAAP